MTERTPLLAAASQSRDTLASDRNAEAEDAALAGKPSPPHPSDPPARRRQRLRETVLFMWGLLATAAVVVLAVWITHGNRQRVAPNASGGKKNLIFMVSDGMGPASLSLTRSFRQYTEDLPIDDILQLDAYFHGTSRTRSSNSLVTDSAAGATAFSCGKKSYNGAIAVEPDYEPCGTVLEAAKRAGYKTGLVVTTDITDATPACFASHVFFRWMEDDIAGQEAGLSHPLGERVVDLMLGGGRCHFLPNGTSGSCRGDSEDISGRAVDELGWTFLDNREGFDGLGMGENVELPLMGFFADYDIPFEIDRRNMNNIYPSLSEMAVTALRALEKATEDSDQGFFLMIEGSRIDHAGHINDPAAQVHEVLEYDKAFKAVIDFLDESDIEGVVVSTSDHETGGLSTALQKPGEGPVYNWHPSVLAAANHSAEHLSRMLRHHIAELGEKIQDPEEVLKLMEWVNTNLVIPGLGITNARTNELEALVDTPEAATEFFAGMISERARIGWATHGHSAVDVNIYSSGGPTVEDLHRNVENTDIGDFLAAYLNVDVDAITKELRENWDKGGMETMSSFSDMMQEVPDHWEKRKETLERPDF
ncbi:putative repressible alkaline phosphatase precursor protein [Zalerion maritima]|uniref:Alkaline phosphatase n=1 Tax=Zalerion maritima TaxID=339359 RepID=A0AAD5WRV3_9PEZI|nr:putative repressible alkaline phosphatase precursor protein [Zalerion maritima]